MIRYYTEARPLGTSYYNANLYNPKAYQVSTSIFHRNPKAMCMKASYCFTHYLIPKYDKEQYRQVAEQNFTEFPKDFYRYIDALEGFQNEASRWYEKNKTDIGENDALLLQCSSFIWNISSPELLDHYLKLDKKKIPFLTSSLSPKSAIAYNTKTKSWEYVMYVYGKKIHSAYGMPLGKALQLALDDEVAIMRMKMSPLLEDFIRMYRNYLKRKVKY